MQLVVCSEIIITIRTNINYTTKHLSNTLKGGQVLLNPKFLKILAKLNKNYTILVFFTSSTRYLYPNMFDENHLSLDQDPTPAPSLLPPCIKKRSAQWPRDFKTIKILSQNVNGLKATKKLEILLRHITINSISAMCLQETWLEKKSQTNIPTVDNKSCMFIHYGPDSQSRRGSGGVGLLLNCDGAKAWKRAGSHHLDYLPIINET